MSANQHAPTLYYSDKDAASSEIVQTLQALNKASLFRFVNVTTTPRQYLPNTLQRVPTLVIPATKETLVGKNSIFAYISRPVQSRREHPSEPAAPPSKPTEPSTWSFSGSSLSETFSSFDESNHQRDDQMYYTYIEAQNQQMTGQKQQMGGGGGADERSKTGRNDDVMSRLENYKSSRDSEFKSPQRV
jgi:hypothetical protein